jgi:hypothetical protein
MSIVMATKGCSEPSPEWAKRQQSEGADGEPDQRHGDIESDHASAQDAMTIQQPT